MTRPKLTWKRVREVGGVLFKDVTRFQRAIKSKDDGWVRLCNRYERLQPAPAGRGVRCDWQWTSVLHAPTVIPSLGRRLLERAAAEFPFEFVTNNNYNSEPRLEPDVSFVIGHRGIGRLGLLLATLQSIQAQKGVRIECIVVEQSYTPEIKNELPVWVKYIHTKPPSLDMPYCRAWAFNVGARAARGRLLVLHDNDLLIPRNYARDHLLLLGAGYEVINLKRFIFYLCRSDTEKLLRDGLPNEWPAPQAILQNALGGGSLAIERSAFLDIGGYDESFFGWGGEDNELWERALLRRVYPYGYLPMIHLWHPEQPDKGMIRGRGRYTAAIYDARSAVEPRRRVAELRQRRFGYRDRPDPLPAVTGPA